LWCFVLFVVSFNTRVLFAKKNRDRNMKSK
jgi:hypothetical protein